MCARTLSHTNSINLFLSLYLGGIPSGTSLKHFVTKTARTVELWVQELFLWAWRLLTVLDILLQEALVC